MGDLPRRSGIASIVDPDRVPGVMRWRFSARQASGRAGRIELLSVPSMAHWHAESDGISPPKGTVVFRGGDFRVAIRAGSFQTQPGGESFLFTGVVNGVNIRAPIQRVGRQRYALFVAVSNTAPGFPNLMPVHVAIGNDQGDTVAEVREITELEH